MTSDVLTVWLHGEHLGDLQRLRNGHNRLRFSAEAVGRWGVGTHVLSYSLPMSIRRVESAALDDYLDNLLPEGPVRAALEQQYGLRPGDGFELLSHIGGDCAGAVQIAVDESPPRGRLVPLADDEVNAIVRDLPTLSPPPGEAVSAALGGVQSKVLLTRTQSGWAWPAAGAVSTHIIKPEPVEPQTVKSPGVV